METSGHPTFPCLTAFVKHNTAPYLLGAFCCLDTACLPMFFSTPFPGPFPQHPTCLGTLHAWEERGWGSCMGTACLPTCHCPPTCHLPAFLESSLRSRPQRTYIFWKPLRIPLETGLYFIFISLPLCMELVEWNLVFAWIGTDQKGELGQTCI